jgi:hypothetical protein
MKTIRALDQRSAADVSATVAIAHPLFDVLGGKTYGSLY